MAARSNILPGPGARAEMRRLDRDAVRRSRPGMRRVELDKQVELGEQYEQDEQDEQDDRPGRRS